ncbi:olfactory receptor 11L1-like [Hyla sarda]|uniref:olfactory receptor 11L1-like n=1 Tax=Hyla sarda TaxID=327740 RepID=UPI0024C36974|nr:olfactory receptor 11L1-like [Hyla sarda]
MDINQTIVTEFFLLGFRIAEPFRVLLFTLFLLTYVITLTGDFLIVTLVSRSHQLQHPMFYFLKHLSVSEILFTSNITPNMLYIILRNGGSVSFSGCIIQFYFYIASGSLESLLLTIMSYDRYLAICNPLRYADMMNLQLCRTLVLASWLLSFTLVLVTVTLLCQLNFCGPNIIDHFFCDFAPLVDLSCSDTSIIRMEVVVLSIPVVASTFSFILWSYICISITILGIHSSTGRRKVFSTCSSHLASVCSYYGPLIVIYMVPYRRDSLNVNKFLSILYTVFTPLFNPLIYSLRNEELQHVLWRLLKFQH